MLLTIRGLMQRTVSDIQQEEVLQRTVGVLMQTTVSESPKEEVLQRTVGQSSTRL